MHLLQIGRAESARARSAHERRPLACDVVTHDSDGSDCQDGDDADQDRVFDHGRAIVFLAQARKENPKPLHFHAPRAWLCLMGARVSFVVSAPTPVALNDRPSFDLNFGRNVIAF